MAQCSRLFLRWMGYSPPSERRFRNETATGRKVTMMELHLMDSLIYIKAISFYLTVIVTEKRGAKGQSEKAGVWYKQREKGCATARASHLTIPFAPRIA